MYPDAVRGKEDSLDLSLTAIYGAHQARFIFLFDEWDVIYREEKFNDKLKKDYTDFLVSIFKNANVTSSIDLVYMTGILPIPKKVTQSGLNNFTEFTMINPDLFAAYFGFTEDEVDVLCHKRQMPLHDLKESYEGYQFGTVGSVYCPASVVKALKSRKLEKYWKRLAQLQNCSN